MTRSIQYAIYLSIFISFVRRILAKARVEPTVHWLSTDAAEEPEYTVFDIPVGNMNPRGLADAIAIALGVPKDRFRLIGGETPDSVQVAFKDKNIADEIAKRMWQSIPTLGDQNAVKAYPDSSIKVYRDTLC